MRFQAIIIVISAVFLAGCSMHLDPYQRGSSTEEIERFAEERFETQHRERDFVRGVLGSVRAQDRETLVRFLAPNLVSPTLQRDLDGFFGNFPSNRPATVEMIGYQTNLDQQNGRPDRLTLRVEYIFDYEGYGPVLFSMTGLAEGAASLRAINLQSRLVERAQWQPQGTLGSTRQTVRVLGIAAPLILVLALLVWLRMASRLRRRLIWLGALLATSPTFSFNWASQDIQLLAPRLTQSDGRWDFDLIAWIPTGVQFAKAGDYNAWIITIGLPLGALWFLFKTLTKRIELREEPLAAAAPELQLTQDATPVSKD